MAIDSKSYVLALLYGNITFYSTFIRLFFILDKEVNHGVNNEVNSKGNIINTIIIDTNKSKDIVTT